MFDPRAPTLAAIEGRKTSPKVEIDLNEMRREEDSKKKDENLYPKMNPAAFSPLSFPIAHV